MDDHRGFSLIELIVVVAVAAVLAGLITMSVGDLSSWKLKKCTENLEKGLAQTKAVCLSRDGAGMEIANVDGEIVLSLYGEPKKVIGDDSISIRYTEQQGAASTQVLLAAGEKLTLSFERSSGAFLPIDAADPGGAVYCSSITVERRGAQRKLVLIPPTGKFYVE